MQSLPHSGAIHIVFRLRVRLVDSESNYFQHQAFYRTLQHRGSASEDMLYKYTKPPTRNIGSVVGTLVLSLCASRSQRSIKMLVQHATPWLRGICTNRDC